MNPLSIWTFHRRYKRHAAMLLGLSIVVTIGLYSMVALMWALFVEPSRLAYMAFSKFSLVTPQSIQGGPDPAVLAQLQANPDMARIMPSTFIRVELPGMVPGQGFDFPLLGLMEEDVTYVLERVAATVKDGRVPEAGSAELALSEDIARMLEVEVGDSYTVTSFEFYAGMDGIPEPTDFEVVGILDSDIELGFVSLEFLNRHEEYRQLPPRLLIVAREGREAAVEGFLSREILSPGTGVLTHQMLSERIVNEALPALIMMLPVILVAGVAFSLVIVVANQLANARRLPEFGILHATGRSKRWLIRRLTGETTVLALTGWAIGIGFACLGLHLLKVTVFAARGYDLNYMVWLPILLSLPIPTAIAGFTFVTVRRTLTQLDAVAIVERRELSQEGNLKRAKAAAASSPKPLSPITFYQRHRRRAVLLIAGMSSMILAVVLFIFTLAVDADAQEEFLGYLSVVSILRSTDPMQSLEPGIVARIEANPAVERVIPFAPRYSMLNASIPPFASAEASPFAVSAEDMAFLVETYGLELKDGHLPLPGSNEMVIPEALAQNRHLAVGDAIGDPDQPAYPNAPSTPVTFVISGIFAQPTVPEAGSGMGFMSLEFLESQSVYDLPDVLSLIVVPAASQKRVLDDWLEKELASAEVRVLTHRQEVARVQAKARQDMSSMALLEGIVAAVAAIGLAVLNHIFATQRHSEFGVLHALGYSRGQLVRRVLGETAFTTGIAWGLSAILAMAGMLFLRLALFAPLGLTFELFSLTPWLYTLPIPIAVLAVNTGTLARTLSRVDAVTIIERR